MKIVRHRFSHAVHFLAEKTKKFFVFLALALYAGSLIMLAQEVSPIDQLDVFLLRALSNLAIPFGVILVQEILELFNTIADNRLRATSQQFEIVALVILRSFFKDFGQLNSAVTAGVFTEPVLKALVKIVALLLITLLVLAFNRLIDRAGVHRHDQARQAANQWQQMMVVGLSLGTLVFIFTSSQKPELMVYIGLVFTGMIVIDAVFFLHSILNNHDFDSLMFDGGLVVSLIFARFPLFAPKILSYILAAIGIAFATVALRLFVQPKELEFLGNPQEDDVARFDLVIKNEKSNLAIFNEKSNQFLQNFDVALPDINKVHLACEELLDSIFTHVHDQEGTLDIHISLALYREKLAITIAGSGPHFNPFKHERPNTKTPLAEQNFDGLGIHIVRNIMDRVSYSREAGRNVLTLLKHLSQKREE